VHDFGKDGTLEQIITFYKHGVSYPMAGRDEIVKLVPSLREKYPTYKAFGASRVEDIFPAADLRRARTLEAHTFASAVAMNTGHGTFALRALPPQAQFAPVRAALAGDFDGDGHVDLLLAGNDYGAPPLQGRYDASYGLLLAGDGHGRFTPVDMEQSGVDIEGQARHMALVRAADGGRLVVVARNNDRLQVLRVGASKTSTLALGRRTRGAR
jgi:hypothetical protein